ncbi:hypothetical protein BH686_07130 [Rhodococcus erythropolis]|uniref:hypothetical protein n=1 Tax=Rhodococcus erythropolis TaxID=1833 RepID=UPI000A03BDF3|nr:hypothetical protein [Rhodococcus erythropolis]ORI19939.1 hypothetical protein BH686_07130 [Rhodococcus erythropolis]
MTETFVWKDKFHWHEAYGMSDVPSNARSVAYIVWDHTDKFGKRGFPGMDILTAKTKLSERQVSRNLQTNQKAGWLDLVVSGSSMGNGRKSEYNLAYPSGYVDHKLDHPTLMSGGDDGKPEPPDTDVINHPTLMSEPPDTDVCPTESLSNPRSDPPPLSSEDKEDDLSYLYEQEINTDTGAAETYAEQWSAAEWRRREETRRVEAEARAERDREYEAKRAQSQAELEALFLTELKSIDWVSNNWAAFEKFCDDENVKPARRLSLAQRARDKSTSSPFGLFKSMIRNGTPGSPSSGRDTSCASPTSGHAWQE